MSRHGAAACRPASSVLERARSPDVATRCGAVFAAAGDGAAEFRSDGSSVLALAGGAVRLAFGPLGGSRGSFLDVALPSDGLGFRREIAGDGTLLACGADLS